MANTNADDSMGVAVEVSIPGANENDILDIENDSDFPSPAEINVARSRPPSRPLEAYEAQLAGTPRTAATIAFDAVHPSSMGRLAADIAITYDDCLDGSPFHSPLSTIFEIAKDGSRQPFYSPISIIILITSKGDSRQPLPLPFPRFCGI